eukprot:SAG22_NODE_5833_length_946_cov_1.144038_1_plen_121_part_10
MYKRSDGAEQQRRTKGAAGPGGDAAGPGGGEPQGADEEEKGALLRLHMLHRVDPVVEAMFLHPRVLDGLEALAGPDVLCLQSMSFFNPAGHGGQGWVRLRAAPPRVLPPPRPRAALSTCLP